MINVRLVKLPRPPPVRHDGGARFRSTVFTIESFVFSMTFLTYISVKSLLPRSPPLITALPHFSSHRFPRNYLLFHYFFALVRFLLEITQPFCFLFLRPHGNIFRFLKYTVNVMFHVYVYPLL